MRCVAYLLDLNVCIMYIVQMYFLCDTSDVVLQQWTQILIFVTQSSAGRDVTWSYNNLEVSKNFLPFYIILL